MELLSSYKLSKSADWNPPQQLDKDTHAHTHTYTHTHLTALCLGHSEWQWYQLDHMQVCTLLQTDNHASTSPLTFFTGRMPFLPPNQQRQSTEGKDKDYITMSQSFLWATRTKKCIQHKNVNGKGNHSPYRSVGKVLISLPTATEP